jgi:hypothetical protein
MEGRMAHEIVETNQQPNGELAADSLQKQQNRLPRGKPWQPGESGNPAGRAHGSRNRATLFAQALFDNELEQLVRKAISCALEGEPMALKLCIERILAPRRHERPCFSMPPLATAEDAAKALAAIAAAAADGELAPAEARDLTDTVGAFIHALDAVALTKPPTSFDIRYGR